MMTSFRVKTACALVMGGGAVFSQHGVAAELTIATVDNRDMLRMRELSEDFVAGNSDIQLNWVTLDESTLRQQVTTDIATSGGRFDIVTIGTYEAPIWAERGWLVPIADMPGDYQPEDLLPTVRQALSYQDVLYAAPFYAESAFTMYRTDLFEDAGLRMPRAPSWDFLAQAAEKLSDSDEHYGICLRGKPGWGENMALLTAMANAFGGRWFDEEWQPQLEGGGWRDALDLYLTLLGEYGPPNPEDNGYNENLALFQQGKCGIWVDATVAASAVTDPEASEVADRVGFALAPDNGLDKRSNWLWAWALAIPTSSEQSEAAKRFVAWATSRGYQELVAEREGWSQVPPGTRASLYDNPSYREAAPYSELVLESLRSANPDDPTVQAVPYRGVQYVAIPAFQGIGTAVGNRFAKALAGDISAEEAIEDAQWVTEKVTEQARFAQQ
ncbi:sugar ABC transporter substrate-binding protein [Halomonas sp. H10-59]|uniref:Sugar ABC transporter substrate-binding protein n=1 Tax=Halomonas sp. H10-59 TaxID=2950874 RepID=A0AAU7KSZ8_9GAMM